MSRLLLVKIVGSFLLSMSIYTDNSLTITLENKSSWPLEWDRTKIFFPATKIHIDPQIIPPGGRAVITGTTNEGVDLSARIFFKNNDMLRIDDYQQLRSAKSIFHINSKHITSQEKDIKYNPERNPKKLSIVGLVIVLEDSYGSKGKF